MSGSSDVALGWAILIAILATFRRRCEVLATLGLPVLGARRFDLYPPLAAI